MKNPRVKRAKMVQRTDFGNPRRRRAPRLQPAPVLLTAALAIAGFGIGCASTSSPRDFVNRLTTPNEGVRADLGQLEERVHQLEGLLAERQSENALLRERIAEVETALAEVRALATTRPQPVPFEPPPPGRVQILEVSELEDPIRTAPPVEANTAADPLSPPGTGNEKQKGDKAHETRAGTGAPATVDATGQELYDRAHEQFLNRDYVNAALDFQRFLDAFPDSDLSDNALYWIGECRFARGDNRGAMAAFQTMLHEYPLGNKVPDALFKVGRTLERLGDTEGARRRFREVSQRFPDSEVAVRATELLSRLQGEV